MNRRHFLRTSFASSLTLASVPSLFALEADNASGKTSASSSTRCARPSKPTPAAALKAVASAGATSKPEMYGFPNCDPMIQAAKDAGLALHSSHFEWDAAVNPKDDAMSDFIEILDKAHATGLKQLVTPALHR